MSRTVPSPAGFTSSIDLARGFYEANQLAFARAAIEPDAKERGFECSADDFDDWAVKAGHMPGTVRGANSAIDAGGLTRLRGSLRSRLNKAARKGDGVPRAFSIEARYGKWRVSLVEKFLVEKPQEFADALRKYSEGALVSIDALKRLTAESEHLSETDRVLNLSRLDNVGMTFFWGVQQARMVAHHLDPNALQPDMRKLGKGMEGLVKGAFYGKTKAKKKAAGRKR